MIRPDELLVEDDAGIGGRQIAQGRWRNNPAVVKILSERAEPRVLHARGEVWTRLHHANVLQVFGISSLDADPLYVVTEFQQTGNVNRFLQLNPEANRAKIVCDVALGMQYLHGCGVVHGSLKPTNILIRVDGQACVADYGIIELQTSGSNGHRYFSPEAWKGTISRASDVFAWGMCALEIFTSKAPWGILSEKQIFRLVVHEGSLPDRPDEDFGLTDHIWDTIEKSWCRDSRRRPSFDIVVQLLQTTTLFKRQSVSSRVEGAHDRTSVPPAYEPADYPGSAPPTISMFRMTDPSFDATPESPLHPPGPPYGRSSGTLRSNRDGRNEGGRNAASTLTRGLTAPANGRRWLSPSPSVRTSSSEVLPLPLGRSEYSGSTVSLPASGSASVFTQLSSVSTPTRKVVPNTTIIVGALASEVKEGRKREVIDQLLSTIQELGLKSDKDAQRLVTAGVMPTLILLMKTQAVGGIGLENVLVTLGILTHDSITANIVYRTNGAATLIEIVNATQTVNITALAIWCLSRVCRSPEIASGLLKQNLGKLLVNKGLRAAWSTAYIAAWCIGALIHSDAIADTLFDIGMVPALCEHLSRCSQSTNTTPEDYRAVIYAVARISRSVKIAKALAKGGCVQTLSNCLNTTEDPGVLLWSARAVGCLMRPNSSDMAKILLDAGVAGGLARLPSRLPTEEVEPLGALAFAVQRFSCAEWGGGTRKALVEAGVVDALLAALRSAADEPYPEVHIELANAITLLADVGGGSIRKEVTNAGGIEILNRVGRLAPRADVVKACNQAASSITGNVWRRNTGASSAKAALAHQWSGGCPDYFPGCPILLRDQ
ncbi:hypothetical protein K438DRAFT_247706 [Mycena galopus ATCC 62051]|nr:hypothetical protein K438DRAFT_247706 [Mycena galopus ATCC 62051]